MGFETYDLVCVDSGFRLTMQGITRIDDQPVRSIADDVS